MTESVRVAELLAAVSAATDFAKGLPEEQALRTCRIAMILADRAALSPADRRTVFCVSLLRFVGCTATAPEMAAALGDELAVSEAFAAVDPRDLRAVLGAAATLTGTAATLTGAGHSPARRAVDLVRFLATAPAVIREHEVGLPVHDEGLRLVSTGEIAEQDAGQQCGVGGPAVRGGVHGDGDQPRPCRQPLCPVLARKVTSLNVWHGFSRTP